MVEQQTMSGFNVIVITDDKSQSKAVLCPERGGILLQLTLQGEDVLYLQEETFADPAKNIRGGNPVLFPICGPLPDNQFTWEGVTYTMKQHGFARNKEWDVHSIDDTKVTLMLKEDEETLKQYPFSFHLLFTYELKDGKLSIQQSYENRSSQTMPFYAGFHPYFLGNHTLSKYNIPAARYLDNGDQQVKSRTQPTAELAIDDAKVYLHLSDPEMCIKDNRRTLHIQYSDVYQNGVLWSELPEEYICLEPWMAGPGSLTKEDGAVFLEAGKTLHAECVYFIEK
ncbi:aldose epimerase [Bacillus sp. 1P06AnD]|uniref:aldose epimerase family protein n=1 Tax=Bacillus sp. 1P06AnD TaxID=3132208 RepID=UPI0039A395AC